MAGLDGSSLGVVDRALDDNWVDPKDEDCEENIITRPPRAQLHNAPPPHERIQERPGSSSSSIAGNRDTAAKSFSGLRYPANITDVGSGSESHATEFVEEEEESQDTPVKYSFDRSSRVLPAKTKEKFPAPATAFSDWGVGEREDLLNQIGALRREVVLRDGEIARLGGVVSGLKGWVNQNTRGDGFGLIGPTGSEVPDDNGIREEWARLGNALQNWVLMYFRRVKIDLSKISEPALGGLSEFIPIDEQLARSAKVHLLQSIVSRVWVDMIFNAYFPGLSQEEAIRLQSQQNWLSSYTSHESINRWRATTLSLINAKSSETLEGETARLIEDLVGRINGILDSITTPTSSNPPTNRATTTVQTRDQALRPLLMSAITLTRQLRTQRASYQVHMPYIIPHQRTTFDRADMEDIGPPGEDEVAGGEEMGDFGTVGDGNGGHVDREVSCVVFPGIVKLGDEMGRGMGLDECRNVLVKIRVLCGSSG